MTRRTTMAAVACALAQGTAAQCPWTAGPPFTGAVAYDMVYDEARQQVITYNLQFLPGFDFTQTWDGNNNNWQVASGTGLPRSNTYDLAYDRVRQRVVCNIEEAGSTTLYDTYEWDGAAWTLATANSPGPGKITYDPIRQHTVLFGGASGDETWTWDGTTWTQVFPADSPPARSRPAMAFDDSRGVLVMYGGGTSGPPSGQLDDLWEWDGNNWHQIFVPGLRPPPLSGVGMDFDDTRQKLVMPAGSTWTYDGCEWERIRDDNAVPIVHMFSYAHHGATGQGIGFNGIGTTPVLSQNDPVGVVTLADTLAVPGATFRMAPSIENDKPGLSFQWLRNGVPLTPSLTYSGVTNRTLTISNYNPGLNGTFEVRVSDSCRTASASAALSTDPCPGLWTLASPAGAPPVRGASLSFQPNLNQSVLFGGLSPAGTTTSGTFLWDGLSWIAPFVQGAPGARFGHSAANNPNDPDNTVVYGGVDAGLNPINNTRFFDGGAWSNGPVGPTATFEGAMVHDGLRALYFGGEDTDAGAFSSDMFQFSAGTWSAIAPQPELRFPNPRAGHAMAHSPFSGNTYVFGGRGACATGTQVFNDLWCFNGSQWFNPLSNSSEPRPPARTGATMVWDDSRQAIILFGGFDPSTSPATFFDDTWEYRELAGWTRLGMNAPPARHSAAMTWDPSRRQAVLTTGQGASSLLLTDTWELDFPSEHPRLLAQPQNASAKVLQNASLSVSAAGAGPLTYLWQKNGVPVVNGPRVSGQGTPTLTFTPTNMGDADSYTCTVSNACGSVTALVTLDVICWVDVNQSGTVDPADFTAWLAAFGNPLDPNRARADQNCDGTVSPADFTAWLANFGAGCP